MIRAHFAESTPLKPMRRQQIGFTHARGGTDVNSGLAGFREMRRPVVRGDDSQPAISVLSLSSFAGTAMTLIHPTAIVDRTAKLGAETSIGPFCVIEADAEIGGGTCIESRAVIKSGTRIGVDNRVGEGAVLGGRPQHAAGPKQNGRLWIGDRNVIRENVTIHRGLHESDATRIGNDNYIMVNAHVGHDCVIGNKTIIANNVMLAGHVEISDQAYVSGAVGVHQFCRIGRLAMVGGQAHINRDVPPFVTIDGLTSRVVGLNSIGLRRAGLDADVIRDLKAAYRIVFRSGLRWTAAIQQLLVEFPVGPVGELREFLETTKRGCVFERRAPKSAIVSLDAIERADSPSTATESVELRVHKTVA
jgi:UDP-N-acetylglucosamine acyltransferase